MSEEERDQIEEDAQNFINSCSSAIKSLKNSGLFSSSFYLYTLDVIKVYSFFREN